MSSDPITGRVTIRLALFGVRSEISKFYGISKSRNIKISKSRNISQFFENFVQFRILHRVNTFFLELAGIFCVFNLMFVEFKMVSSFKIFQAYVTKQNISL